MSKRNNQQSQSRAMRRQGLWPAETKGTPYVKPPKTEEKDEK